MDSLVANPGLSHLGAEIFLGLDLESFGRLELVCRAWRCHAIENALWRQRLRTLAKATSYNMDLIEGAIKDVTDKEELSKKCKSLCRNLVARKMWLDPNVKLAKKKTFEMTRPDRRNPINAFAIAGEREEDERLFYVRGHKVCTLTSSGMENSIGNPKLERHVSSMDVHGDYMAVGTAGGTVAICDWRHGRHWLPEATVATQESLVRSICFASDGRSLVSAHEQKVVLVWNFSGETLSQVQRLEDRCVVSRMFADVSWEHLVMACLTSIHFYAQDVDGTYVERGRCQVEEDHATALRVLRSAPLGVSWYRTNLRFWDLNGTQGGDNPFLLGNVSLAEDPELRICYVLSVTECPEAGLLAFWVRRGRRGCYEVVLMPVPDAAGNGPIPAALVHVPLQFAANQCPANVPRLGFSKAKPGSLHVIYSFSEWKDYTHRTGQGIYSITLENAGKKNASTALLRKNATMLSLET